MNAETLSCPMCGAATEPRATQCAFCRARLATVSCPACYGLVFVGSRHCGHCGTRVAAPVAREGPARRCPRGCGALRAVTLGQLALDACPSCEGTWVDVLHFEQLCADAERQAAVLAGTPETAAVAAERVRYGPCPECAKILNRVNFAKSSGIIVDLCKAHGVWLDADELRRVVEFLRAGGLERARLREKRSMEEELRLLRLKQELGRQDSRELARREDDRPTVDNMLVSIFSHFVS
jgi:Zn-finger nucleic acid-binding protein